MAYNTKNILRSGDASPIPIPQFYNPTEDAFNPLTGANLGSGRYGADGVMWGKTAGGVYIPVQVNANGEVLTQLSGSNVQESQAIPTKNSYKDIAMRAYDNIINKVGAENIQCLLPMWETGGTIVKDLLRGNDIQFDIIGATLNQPSTPNYGLKFDGVNDYAIFKAEVETTVQNDLISLDGASKKFAQKLSPKTSLSVGMINLWVQKTGTPNQAALQVQIIKDADNSPTGEIVATSSAWIASSISNTVAGRIGFAFADKPYLRIDAVYWCVVSYSNSSDVNSFNYLSIGVDTTNNYKQPCSIFDGIAWANNASMCAKFALYNSNMRLPDDWTTCIVAELPFLSSGLNINDLYSMGRIDNSTGAFSHDLELNHGVGILHSHSQGLSINTHKWSSPGIHSFFSVFSKSATTGKHKLYIDDKLLGSIAGSAGDTLPPLALPPLLGTRWSITASLGAYPSCFYNKTLNSLILFKKVLTDVEISYVHSELMALRKRQEV